VKLKYLVIPGYVISENDGDLHYIGAPKLMRLYGVDPRECIAAPDDLSVGEALRRYPDPDLIILIPDHSGEYKVPCDGCHGSKWERVLGRDNEEIVIPCSLCQDDV
jgi:hypothetical protein